MSYIVDQESKFYFFDPSIIDGDKIEVFINNRFIKNIDLVSELETIPFIVRDYSAVGSNTMKIRAASTGSSGGCTFNFYIENNIDGTNTIVLFRSYDLELNEEIIIEYVYDNVYKIPTPTPTSTSTPTNTPALSSTPGNTPTPTSTPSSTVTSTNTPTSTFTPSTTTTATPTSTITPTNTLTPSATPTTTTTPTVTPSVSLSPVLDCPILVMAVCYLHSINTPQPLISTILGISLSKVSEIIDTLYPCVPIKPSPTPTATQTRTPAPTKSLTPTRTGTPTPTSTPTLTVSVTTSPTPTTTPEPTSSSTPTPQPTLSPTVSPTTTITPTNTQTPTITQTPTTSPSINSLTQSRRRKGKGFVCDPYIISGSELSHMNIIQLSTKASGKLKYDIKHLLFGVNTNLVVSILRNGIRTQLGAAESSPTPTRTPTTTPSPTKTQTPTKTATPTKTCTSTASATPTPTLTTTPTSTITETPTLTPTKTPTPTNTPTQTSTTTPSLSLSPSSRPAELLDNIQKNAIEWLLTKGFISWEIIEILQISMNTYQYYMYLRQFKNTPVPTSSVTPTITPTSDPTTTPTRTPTQTPTITKTQTKTPTPTRTTTPTKTPTPDPTSSSTPTQTPEPSASPTPSITPTATLTPTITQTPSITPSITPSKDNCLTYVFPEDIIEIYCSGDCPPRQEPPPDNNPRCKDTSVLCPNKPQYGCEGRIELSIDFMKRCE